MEENLKLVDALEKSGTRARPIIGGLFKAEYLNQSKYGLVGRITGVNKALIDSSIDAGALPIVTSLAETPDGQILNINADTAAGELAKVMEPMKIVFVNSTGAMVHPVTQERIGSINLDEEFDRLRDEFSKASKKGTLVKLLEIKGLLDVLPRTSSVAITSAANLSQELFSVGGSGTFISRGHCLIKSELNQLDDGEAKRLTELFRDQEAVRLSPSTDLKRTANVSVFRDSECEIAAILSKNDDPSSSSQSSVSVLNQLVLTRSAMVSNLMDEIWEKMRRDVSKLIWYVDDASELQSYFFEKSDGCVRVGGSAGGCVFWYGLDELAAVEKFRAGLLASSGSADASTTTSSASVMGRAFQHSQQRRSFSTTHRTLNHPTRSVQTKRLALIGARGYTGQELISLIARHPHLQLTHISSRELAGQTLTLPNGKGQVRYDNLSASDVGALVGRSEVDCVILALPNAVGIEFVKQIKRALSKRASTKDAVVVVDLSADHRFTPDWTYGLPELYNTRQSLRATTNISSSDTPCQWISNPGCYATSAQLALYPLYKHHLISPSIPPVVFGMSGYSGAGTSPSPKNDVDGVLKDNVMPYALVNHVHEREMSRHLSRCYTREFDACADSGGVTGVQFIPHVAPFFRGLITTVNVSLTKSMEESTLRQLYAEEYKGERLVKLMGKGGEGVGGEGIPTPRDVAYQHGCVIGGFRVQQGDNVSGGRVVMVSGVDNLLKGAATQAIQNLNLALSWDELTSIAH